MTKQKISEEAKQEVLRLLEERITEYEGRDINKAVLAVNLSIFQEENEELKNQIMYYQEELQILTGDIGSALDSINCLIE
tara:strand:+ start:2832 stop:3071 length:240 start_codon:yes stop_codon:yes gene_type:complete